MAEEQSSLRQAIDRIMGGTYGGVSGVGGAVQQASKFLAPGGPIFGEGGGGDFGGIGTGGGRQPLADIVALSNKPLVATPKPAPVVATTPAITATAAPAPAPTAAAPAPAPVRVVSAAPVSAPAAPVGGFNEAAIRQTLIAAGASPRDIEATVAAQRSAWSPNIGYQAIAQPVQPTAPRVAPVYPTGGGWQAQAQYWKDLDAFRRGL